jgi:hypothetical protein
MLILRTLFVMLAGSVSATASSAAQQSEARLDSVRVEIQTTLRSFYFNLAHRDWEALTADILAAKVVAHRPAPDRLVAAASRPSVESPGPGGLSLAANPAGCPSDGTPLIDQAQVTLEGDWAEVTVPRCPARSDGADEFRLIRFEQRWRIVYIALYPDLVNSSTAR